AGLRELSAVMDRALEYCLALTVSAFGFVGLVDGPETMDVAAIRGFVPDRPDFYERFRKIPIRRTIFGVVILEGRPNISNDVQRDPLHRGAPPGHPGVETFLGVPLKVRDQTIGMIGVANRPGGYDARHERLLSTFANQVAVAIENARLYERQREMIAHLQQLHARLDAARVEALLHQERNRIAADLHDRVAQIMFGIGIEATWCRTQPGVPEAVSASLDRIRQLAARGAAEVRRVVYDLATLPESGRELVEELRRLVEAHRSDELQVEFVLEGKPRRLPHMLEDAILLIAGEALTNVRRHAGADLAVVSLHFTEQAVTLVVQDNGRGIAPHLLSQCTDQTGHLGLRSMRRRAQAVGGELHLQNGEDGGFVVRVVIPAEPRW
ncbi:MAG: GAF domain-containing sensor histidine kinase, partial [Thermomicrobium sp.]|nr:GAF domain-containing sensor histidine kinase [Thermomicrobium sp.]